MSRPAHALRHDQLLIELGSDDINGLSSNVAKQRLEELGRNEIGNSNGVSVWKIVVAQVANAMTMVRLFAYVLIYLRNPSN